MRHKLWPSMTVEKHWAEGQEFFGKPDFLSFVAEENNGELIGFSEASIRPFANGCKDKPVVFLEGIWVEDSCRKRGIGRSLISAIETWARENGFKELGADCLISNSIAINAHDAWGFKETERVIYFRKDLA
ncbi:GNAT family N-acetyltransferase [Acidobacteria bacterium AH-259-D05]|nr:GNAT family N-acetyltransferase [Acidobacteria bacterium AH-259-D05]